MKKSDKIISTILIIAIIASINFISYNFFKRFDITDNKNYSISNSTKKTLGNLNDVVNIYAYLSKNVPSQYISVKQDAVSIISEYVANSHGKIKYKLVESTDDATKQKLQEIGIPEVQFNIIDNDQYQLTSGYMGIILEYGTKKEIIPFIKDPGSLEYQITLAIKRLTRKNMIEIGYAKSVNENNSPDPKDDIRTKISNALDSITQIYALNDAYVDGGQGLGSKESASLLLVNPKFEEKYLNKIDGFFMDGKPLIILLDGVKIENNSLAVDNKDSFIGFLAKYGITVKNNLILDESSGLVNFRQGFMQFAVPYPYWPLANAEMLNQSNPITNGMQAVLLPWVSSIDVKQDSGLKVEKLVTSSKKSWEEVGKHDIDPNKALKIIPPSKPQGEYTLAAVVSGKFTSPYTKKKVENKMVIVGDSDFIANDYSSNNDNLAFFSNIVDSVSLDNDLSSIRIKQGSTHPIKTVSDNKRKAIKYSNIFIIPIIILAFGVFRYYRRKK